MWQRKLAEILLPVGTAMAAYATTSLWPDLSQNQAASWAIMSLAGAFVLYGILHQLLDRNRRYKTLRECADWIGMKSNWTKKYRTLGDDWVTYLSRDLLDALGTGQVRARGRKPFSSGISLNGAEPIASSFWPEAQIHLTHNINDKGDALIHGGSRWHIHFTEVEIDFNDVRQAFGTNWLRLLTWRRTPLFLLRKNEAELEAKIRVREMAGK